MEQVPTILHIGSVLTSLLTLYFFGRASHWHRRSTVIVLIWMLLIGILALAGFFTVRDAMPPRPMLLLGPPVLLIAFLFLTRAGRQYLDGLDQSMLTLLHSVRIPVELTLFGLFTYGAVPQLMTFEGENPDILSGVTALLVFWFGYHKKLLPRWALIAWNIAGLLLLFNIVGRAVLAIPTPFQRLAFDQPNIGVLYFPFVWLPCLIVPLVLFAHLATLRQLLNQRTTGHDPRDRSTRELNATM
jgi:hypothetical protein